MKTVEGAKGRVSCQRLVIAVSLLGLSGCVSAVTDDEMAANTNKPEIAAQQRPQTAAAAVATPAAGTQPGHYVDPAVASASGGAVPAQPQTPGGPAQVYGAAADIGGLTTQPTAISAGTSSIYSTARAATPSVATDGSAAAAPSQKIIPAVSSVYSAPAQPQLQPQPVSAPAPVPVAEQHSENREPVPTPAPQQLAAAAAAQPAANVVPAGEKQESEGTGVTLAAFFAGAAKKRLPKMIESGSAATTEVASLPGGSDPTMGIALSGRSMMSEEFDDAHLEDEDDQPTGLMKLASLSGLTRVSPNGLFLQTDRVEVGCFKPELVRMIKDVERHYNSPAIVTSGYRPPKGVRQGSKHYTCDAADIQIKGVSKWELATYLRSLPERGGVGTYCHTESVHMDTGEPRDWNWRCRRTAARK
ncbi:MULTISPECIES: YcbK family protein [Rhizobium/Agrobacterium group]|uniref:YcbK family protein n=1 Tax=Rhizobium/Agrobacterium group TaxID=227290 RepID=UPI0022FFE47C|nr:MULTISPECIES: D-Ala-D-Ala carboxypeptidase family metallohydrolase [Rhizobium/Agrobacterium group]MDA5635769.1 D-Ala-D-Ala carboxypeptidase family metallohydrolase [Agrobacterium sp. ST15.16.024]MDF1891534.1 D-Ala-D-Ala carboxypeptidase family metallohydrolase [Rhizobium rhizogenes]